MGEPEEPARVRTDHVVPGGAQLLDRVRVAALERRAECPPVVGAEREEPDEKAAAEEDGSAKTRFTCQRLRSSIPWAPGGPSVVGRVDGTLPAASKTR